MVSVPRLIAAGQDSTALVPEQTGLIRSYGYVKDAEEAFHKTGAH